MSKTRVESYDTRVKSYIDVMKAINNSSYLSTEDAMVTLLAEIAGSLAVIADAITEKKEGDVK